MASDQQLPVDTELVHKTAQMGDVVTVDLNLTPENGYVPIPLFDTSGTITFVLGWGNYLPGLHKLVEGMREGESIENVSIDAGWGKRREELIVTAPKSSLKSIKDLTILKPGCHLHLEGDVQVLVTDVTDDNITVDANPPLAGASYRCELTIQKVESLPPNTLIQTNSKLESTSRYQVATFGLGCFWGAQLAFARVPGVAGTKVGYTQGIQPNPTYEQVCNGKTRHREAVTVIYNPNEVTYAELIQVALTRLDQTTDVFKLHELFATAGDDESEQYRHGFYYHTDEQKRLAEEVIKVESRFRIELLPASQFYDAEEYHQHYLLKGGQSSRKGAKETIRCFG
jgi:peptide-methionine (S)-S-oxide reductase